MIPLETPLALSYHAITRAFGTLYDVFSLLKGTWPNASTAHHVEKQNVGTQEALCCRLGGMPLSHGPRIGAACATSGIPASASGHGIPPTGLSAKRSGTE